MWGGGCRGVYVCVCICDCVKCILYLQNLHSLAFFLSVVDYLLPRTIHSLKNQSLGVLGLVLSLKSPRTVELFRELPQSRLKELQFISCDEQVVRLCCSQMCLLLNSLLYCKSLDKGCRWKRKWQPLNDSWWDPFGGG